MFTQEKHFFSCWNGGTRGMRNELYPRLKWLHRPVQCARFSLTRGQKELWENASGRKAADLGPIRSAQLSRCLA